MSHEKKRHEVGSTGQISWGSLVGHSGQRAIVKKRIPGTGPILCLLLLA